MYVYCIVYPADDRCHHRVLTTIPARQHDDGTVGTLQVRVSYLYIALLAPIPRSAFSIQRDTQRSGIV